MERDNEYLDRDLNLNDRDDDMRRDDRAIERREDTTDEDRVDPTIDRSVPGATGDVLGISQVPTGPTGEIRTPERAHGRDDAGTDEDHVLPLEDEVDLGARDVTKNGRGQTGPETGGHGSTPRRTGATGMDIG